MNTQDESAVALDMLLKTVFIVSEESFSESTDGFATSTVGTGPYTLNSYTPGSTIQIIARDDYWQTNDELISSASKLGSVQTINYTVITESSQLSLALQMGDVDAVYGTGLSNADLGTFLDEERNPLD